MYLVVLSLNTCLVSCFPHACLFSFIIVGENQRTGREADAPVSISVIVPAPGQLVPRRPPLPVAAGPKGAPQRLWGQLCASVKLSLQLRVAVFISLITTLGSSVENF